jgi:hypothetical protein
VNKCLLLVQHSPPPHPPARNTRTRRACLQFQASSGLWGHQPPPPQTTAVGEQECGHARYKQADQSGRIYRMVIADSVKLGENVINS